jgi:hypothetical protein
MASTSVIGLVATGAVINTVHTVREGKNPFTGLVAAGVFTGLLIFVTEYVNGSLGTTLAALYLLASFLFHGQVFINALVNLTGSK